MLRHESSSLSAGTINKYILRVYFLMIFDAGYTSGQRTGAHIPSSLEFEGSNPSPATILKNYGILRRFIGGVP